MSYWNRLGMGLLVPTLALLGCSSDENAQVDEGDAAVQSDDAQATTDDVILGDGTLTWTSLAVGPTHSCGVVTGALNYRPNHVFCWGPDVDHQLGSASLPPDEYGTPVAVSSVDNASTVAVGPGYSCAADAEGELKCWGLLGSTLDGDVGLYADGYTGPDAATQVCIGDDFVCALDDGEVTCWGKNRRGQVGVDASEQAEPTVVAELPEVTTITCGDAHVCALDTAKRVWCWGDNENGQLGGETETEEHFDYDYIWTEILPRPKPFLVEGLDPIVTIDAGGASTVAVTEGGDVYRWGRWEFNTTKGSLDLALVSGLPPIADAAIHDSTLCAQSTDGELWCAGNNRMGQFGIGHLTNDRAATQVPLEHPVATFDVSSHHVCAIDSEGTAFCWGLGLGGLLGNGVPAHDVEDTPAPIDGLEGFTAVAAGQEHACGLDGAGATWCWGQNGRGQAGSEATTFLFHEPTRVEALAAMTQLSAGHEHTCGLNADGEVWCWGGNDDGQLGRADDSDSAPAQVDDLPTIVALASGGRHTTAIDDAGVVHTWGANEWGQLGDGATDSRASPAVVDLAVTATAIVADDEQTCIVDTDGAVWCWGNFETEDGEFLTDFWKWGSLIPEVRPGFEGVAQLVHTDESIVALLADGAVIGDGLMRYGPSPLNDSEWQGDPSSFDLSGAQIDGLVAGWRFVCGWGGGSDTLSCWGRAPGTGEWNSGRQQATAETVTFSEAVVDAAGGLEFTCAILTGGKVSCVGYNEKGQLGRGHLMVPTPTPLVTPR